MEHERDLLARLLRQISLTGETELACDEVFRVLDEVAEAVQRGEDLTEFAPLVKQHLDLCQDCCEEYEALLRILGGVS